MSSLWHHPSYIDYWRAWLVKSTEVIRFELLIATFNFSEINSNFRYFILKKCWYMMQHSIFNLLVANNRLLSVEFNIQFFAVWKIGCWMQHSIFQLMYLKIWLLTTTFNFQFFLCKTMGCQLQHSIIYSYVEHIRSFTFEFRRFVS